MILTVAPVAPVAAAESSRSRARLGGMPCQWCGTIFCWDYCESSLGGTRKNYCAEECRKLDEERRHRMLKLRRLCESGEMPGFDSRRDAWQEAYRLIAETGGRHRAYDQPCVFCGRWHVAPKKKRYPRPGIRRRFR